MPKKDPPDRVVADWEVRDYAGADHKITGAYLDSRGGEYRFISADDGEPVFLAQKQTVAHVRRVLPEAAE